MAQSPDQCSFLYIFLSKYMVFPTPIQSGRQRKTNKHLQREGVTLSSARRTFRIWLCKSTFAVGELLCCVYTDGTEHHPGETSTEGEEGASQMRVFQREEKQLSLATRNFFLKHVFKQERGIVSYVSLETARFSFSRKQKPIKKKKDAPVFELQAGLSPFGNKSKCMAN